MTIHDHTIRIPVGDESIDGTIVAPSTKIPGVLFVHGWGGSQEQYLARAREIAALGCICLTFDLRGHAGTRPQQGTVSRENSLNDVLAAYDMLAGQRDVDPDAIAVVGSSYGGYLAAILTSLRPVKWLALRVPALYRDSNWEMPKLDLHKGQDLGAYRQTLVSAEENRALRACAEFRGDVLIVESERDNIIPHAVISSYLEACAEPRSMTYRVIKGADHGLSEQSSQRAYTALLVSWMTEMVLGERGGEQAGQTTTMPAGTLPEAPPTPG
ncbi:alpha/beta fold hydrolase [Noviherbaspirillum sp. CPCC 100848]|uniref:Alpha/beta fold hydrolase n=1 Tax=Noviherbaspirillum album TaxID=3080276 RepID=A0ABU6J3C3_9BURK|nr:alpha/beta fold hydrolase [Noviherbaspirillum sp. CPCC 100848]MEC4717948.1 alpha/beta fold hydrolase [Noviherbaspirillum sp. CPCC 100848]